MPARNPVTNLVNRQGRLNHPVGRKDGKWYTLAWDSTHIPATTVGTGGADPDFTLVGTGTIVAPTFVNSTSKYPGGMLFATRTASAADNDFAGIFPATVSRWGHRIQPTTNNVQRLIGVVRTGASIAETSIRFGWKLTNAIAYATDDDQAFFTFDTDATPSTSSVVNWVAVNSTANADTYTNTGIAVAADTDYLLRVDVGADLKSRFYINDVLVHTGSVAFASASINLLPHFYVISRVDAGGAKSHAIRSMIRSHYTA